MEVEFPFIATGFTLAVPGHWPTNKTPWCAWIAFRGDMWDRLADYIVEREPDYWKLRFTGANRFVLWCDMYPKDEDESEWIAGSLDDAARDKVKLATNYMPLKCPPTEIVAFNKYDKELTPDD